MKTSAGSDSAAAFDAIGNEFLCYFQGFADLQPNQSVLEVGCGTGRMAGALAGYLDDRGSYSGFDASKPVIEWCQMNITPRFSSFIFEWWDIANSAYNPNGRFLPETFQFPLKDESFDFVFLTSVFTHMLPLDLVNYLSEVRRVLRTRGHCLITYFLLNDDQAKSLRRNPDRATFTNPFRNDGDPYAVQFPGHSESVIGYDESYIRGRYEALNLEIRQPIRYGNWPGREHYTSSQDIVVARKR